MNPKHPRLYLSVPHLGTQEQCFAAEAFATNWVAPLGPVWKPMHLQPVFTGCRAIGGPVAEGLFVRGLCLSSRSAMSDADLECVVQVIHSRVAA